MPYASRFGVASSHHETKPYRPYPPIISLSFPMLIEVEHSCFAIATSTNGLKLELVNSKILILKLGHNVLSAAATRMQSHVIFARHGGSGYGVLDMWC
jgi:hypothetical protein